MKTGVTQNRTIYFDYLRVFATAAVILLHVAAFNWLSTDVNGYDWKVFNFYDSIVRWGVPVFVMISGALFLGRDDISIKKIYSKYILRLATAYIFWSFIYYLFAGETVLKQFQLLFQSGGAARFTSIINGPYHLWFVPMIAGIYMCIPFLKQIVKNQKTTTYFLILSFIFWFVIPQCVCLINDFGGEKLINITNVLYERVNALQLNLVLNYAFYFVLGYRLSKIKFEKKTRLTIYALGVFGTLFTIIIEMIVSIKTQTATVTYYANSRVNIFLEALAIFELCKNIQFKENKLIVLLSKWSFGAYLVHALIIEQIAKHGLNTLSFNSAIATLVIVAIVFVVSFAISGIMHRIPIAKKYIV